MAGFFAWFFKQSNASLGKLVIGFKRSVDALSAERHYSLFK
jgi:hypothetical protein